MKNYVTAISYLFLALILWGFARPEAVAVASDSRNDQNNNDQNNVACDSEALIKQLRRAGFAFSSKRLQDVAPSANTPEVRVIYLVPSDVQPRPDYPVIIANAIKHLQRWYGDQLADGKTFALHDPIVETVRSGHDSNWFITHPNGDNPALYLWFNSVAEASARFNDPNYIYVIYADVDSAGQAVGGTSGVALLPRHDLLGLAGQHPVEKNVCRWVGGLGHELGHALGLPHPPECDSHQAPDNSPPCQSLMYLGYIRYPDTHFTDEHKNQLRQNPFIIPQQLDGPSRGCSDLQEAGPSISSATFDGKKKLTIEGSKFGGAPTVLINEKDRTKYINSSSDSFISLKAKKKKLGINTGDNTVRVIDAAGLTSNVFTLKF